MPHFVIEYTYSADTAAGRDQHRTAHRAWLADLVEQQTVIVSGPYADDSGAFIVVDAADTATVEQLVTRDPFVIHGLVPAHRIIEWTPVLGVLSH
ncbi:YciI family protein [Rhodococcus koreensis]